MDDYSMITSISQVKREDTNNSLEESSWDFYLQDFLCENEHGNNDGGLNGIYERSNQNNSNNNKNSGKRKVFNQGVFIDDDLQDTATSPVNSPNKVSYMKDFEMKQMETSINAYTEEVERKRSSSIKFDVGEDNGDITELKKRGLCLVPLSSVANYFSYQLS